jgi:hypothetical protein
MNKDENDICVVRDNNCQADIDRGILKMKVYLRIPLSSFGPGFYPLDEEQEEKNDS